MGARNWDVPETEEGLQSLLAQISECRASGDDLELGRGLLALSHLVKWVRSDTDADPFTRSNELAHEALAAFRRCGDKAGQVRSLVAGTALAAPQTRDALLAEAERISTTLVDENFKAMVIAARARGLGMSDRNRAATEYRRAIEIYDRTSNKRGKAQCLFGLALALDDSAEKRDVATEAASLFQESGDQKEAARCLAVAFMNAEEVEPLATLEPLARQGLEAAQAVMDTGLQGVFYTKLAMVAVAKGESEKAATYRRWADELQESDGLSARERWENDMAMVQLMVSIAKQQDDKEAARVFGDELKQLKARKPQ